MVSTEQLISEVVIKDSATAVADRVSAAMDRMAEAEERVQDGADQVDKKVTGSTRTLETYAKGFETLKSKVDPLYASQQRLANIQVQLDKQVAAGVASQAEAAAVMEGYRASILKVGNDVKGFTTILGLNRIGMMELQAAGINSFQALAAGMSPLRVATMEGSQAIGAFVQGGLSLGGILEALTDPAVLAIGAFVALAAGVAAMTISFKDNISAADALKETQAALKDTLGDSATGADDLAAKYNKLSAAMKGVEQVAILAAQRAITQEQTALKGQATEAIQGFNATRENMLDTGIVGPAGALTPGLQQQFDILNPAVTALDKGGVADFVNSLHQLSQTIGGDTGKAIEKLAESMVEAAKRSNDLTEETRKLTAEQDLLAGNATTSDKAILDLSKHVKEHTSALSDYIKQLTQQLAAQQALAAGGEGLKAVTEAQAKAQEDYNKGLRDSPLLTSDEAQKVRDLAKARSDLANIMSSQNAAMKNGDLLTPEQVGQIKATGEPISPRDLIPEINSVTDATKNWRQASVDATQAIGTAFEDATVQGKGLRDVLQGLEQDIARIILRVGVTKPLENALAGDDGKSGLLGTIGTAAGGFLGNIFGDHAISNTVTDLTGFGASGGAQLAQEGTFGGFAGGGDPPIGVPSIVGENGPELFVPKVAGTIVPNHMLGGSGPTINVSVDARGSSDPGQVEAAAHRAVVRAAPAIIQASVVATQRARQRNPAFFSPGGRA